MGAFDQLEWTYNGAFDSFSASGGGNLNKNFPKIQMPGGSPGGMFKLRFEWYITVLNIHKERTDRLSSIDIAIGFTDRNTNRKRNFGTFRVNDVQ